MTSQSYKPFRAKRRIQVKLSPDKLMLLRVTGKYNNEWGPLKFVFAEIHGHLYSLFYDPKVNV